ncbi:hypothetical protein FRUB_07733 [Fimbriiglobus ruber]|uniref:Uncharacterized protein n=1 Tax=Fimbriiglobus ruber TaxID=1908690 RepID=A0A225DCA1_9BACT|nr:hypothetical protein FRUB_07733 [Fimbriiglobus ruber]
MAFSYGSTCEVGILGGDPVMLYGTRNRREVRKLRRGGLYHAAVVTGY